jgi:hypothetical protein
MGKVDDILKKAVFSDSWSLSICLGIETAKPENRLDSAASLYAE